MGHVDYALAEEPLLKSRCGIAATILGVIAIVPALGLLLATYGASLIAHDPSGDAGGPLFIVAAMAFTTVLAIAFGLLWLTGIILAILGLVRTRGRCGWSRTGIIILLIILLGGSMGAAFIWNFAR